MEWVVGIIKILALLIAAAIIGQWYLSEVKKAKAAKAPWYAPYMTIPGIMVLLIVIGLPILVWYVRG